MEQRVKSQACFVFDKITTGDSHAYGGVVKTDALVTIVSSINVFQLK